MVWLDQSRATALVASVQCPHYHPRSQTTSPPLPSMNPPSKRLSYQYVAGNAHAVWNIATTWAVLYPAAVAMARIAGLLTEYVGEKL